MHSTIEDALAALSDSTQMKVMLGRLVADDGLRAAFSNDPSTVLARIGMTATAEQISVLEKLLGAVDGLDATSREKIRELVVGLDKTIQ